MQRQPRLVWTAAWRAPTTGDRRVVFSSFSDSAKSGKEDSDDDKKAQQGVPRTMRNRPYPVLEPSAQVLKAKHSPTNDWDTNAVWVDAGRAVTVTTQGRSDTQNHKTRHSANGAQRGIGRSTNSLFIRTCVLCERVLVVEFFI